jgi:hypothetical protein
VGPPFESWGRVDFSLSLPFWHSFELPFVACNVTVMIQKNVREVCFILNSFYKYVYFQELSRELQKIPLFVLELLLFSFRTVPVETPPCETNGKL